MIANLNHGMFPNEIGWRPGNCVFHSLENIRNIHTRQVSILLASLQMMEPTTFFMAEVMTTFTRGHSFLLCTLLDQI